MMRRRTTMITRRRRTRTTCSSMKMFASKLPRLLRCRREGPLQAVLQVGGEEQEAKKLTG
jgi:hypothetical protein